MPSTRRTRAKAHVAHHYYRHMPTKKHHRILVWALFLFISAVIAAQVLYPLDRALPLARIGGDYVGYSDQASLAKRINDDFMKTEVLLASEKGTPQRFTISSAGAEPQTDAMINRLSDYPFWPRLIPFSILLQAPQLTKVSATFDETVLAQLTQSLSQKLSHPATNAGLAIKNAQIVATADMPGQIVSSQMIARQIEKSALTLGTTTQLTPDYIVQPATTTSADFAEVKARAEVTLSRPLRFESDGKVVEPSPSQRAAWFRLVPAEKGSVTLAINRDSLASYFDELDNTVGRAAGETNVRLVDGKATDTNAGRVGRAVDQPALSSAISAWLLQGDGQPVITVPLKDVPPKVIYDHKYTSSQAGLQAYVSDAARQQNANIVIQQIDGQKWQASDSPDLSVPSASTFKLFIALDLFDRMNKGQIGWDDPILDTDVTTCFDRMTIASTNPCAVEWLNQWGRQSVNQFVYSNGFSHGTDFTNPQATHTTAADLAKFMLGFENGSLISGAQRARLLHSLSVHPYRYGIPTGSQGQVWDKVGFLWDYVHDAAIVHHPKGKYVMVVMTKGRSYGTIAQITRDVERIMYP